MRKLGHGRQPRELSGERDTSGPHRGMGPSQPCLGGQMTQTEPWEGTEKAEPWEGYEPSCGMRDLAV